jgi:hypothetical protein
MKTEILCAFCGVMLVSVMVLSINIKTNESLYETQYIAVYDDGHNEIVCIENKPPRNAGSIFECIGSKWEVKSVADYWYEGLDIATIYHIVKVKMK